MLDVISKNGGNVLPFVEYAVQGLVDQLREQIEAVQEQVRDVVWRELVNRVFGSKKDHRKRGLLLAISARKTPVHIRELRGLTPELAAEYAGKTGKTISRDVNALVKERMLERSGTALRARTERVLAFLPVRSRKEKARTG
jgi:hypothetical protein